MKTLFVGGGQGCSEVLELVEQGRLGFLGIEVVGVMDLDDRAPGMAYARRRGLLTFDRLMDGLNLPDLELVIELTGSDAVADEVRYHAPPGVRIIDHDVARVFWDLEKVTADLRQELRTRTKLQSEIARDRLQLQHILDALPDLVVVLDQEARVARVNRSFEKITGKTLNNVHGKPIREIFQSDEPESWSDELGVLFEQITTHGRPVSIVRNKQLHSGRRGYFQITADPIFDEDLQIVRVVESAREITEQVMLKRETEETARRFQQIVDAVHGLITIKDVEGRYVAVNPWTEKVVGIPREQMIGKTAYEVLPKEAAAMVHRLDRETLEAGGRHVSEETMTLGGVERFFVSERLPLTDYKGDVVGICCISQDLTHRRQLQNDLAQTERLAAVGKLAAGVAHEINNPLSGILAFAQDLLLEADQDDPARADYELIVNETLRCRRIVRSLLDFSRQRSPSFRRVAVGELVSRVLPMVERQASFHNIEFDVALPEDLPALHVDPQQMHQVLLNLVINARDAMDGRGVVRIRAERADDDRSVVVSIGDSGCGITSSQLERIFEPFYSTKGEQGHGLGLTAVRNVVERHRGRIEVDSERNVGTTFRITLPVSVEKSDESREQR